MNKSNTLKEKIQGLLDSHLPLIESSLNEKSRFTLRAYDPETSKSLFKGNAASPTLVKSMIGHAAQHMRDGGMNKIRITVHDHKHGMISDHKLTKRSDGTIHTSGPDPETHFDD